MKENQKTKLGESGKRRTIIERKILNTLKELPNN